MPSGARSFLTKHPRAEWAIPAAFCLILLAQMLFSVRQMSQHADEATHLYAGYRVLKCSDYAFGREHPPLAKMIAAAPLLWSNIPMDCSQREVGDDEEEQATRWLYSRPDWWPLLMRARMASSLTAVALCMGVWMASRRMFGRMTAVVATTVLVFEPNVLAHGALLLNNILLAALFLLTVFCFYLWTEQRSTPLLLANGLCLGLALLTKHSAAMLVFMLIGLAVGDAWLETSNNQERARRVLRNFGALALMLVIAAATIWGGYGMRYSQARRRASDSISEEQLAALHSPVDRVLKEARIAHLLPQQYVDGLIQVRGLVNDAGYGNKLLDQYYATAPWFFFPLTMTVKFTLGFLAMLAMGAAGLIVLGQERRKEIVFLLVPALLYFIASLNVPRFGGIWHLFPMISFLLIAAVAGCVLIARRYRWAGLALGCLLALHVISSLRSYPNYLSYANEAWGGPGSLYNHLPWTDLDQTFWQVRHYMEQHPNTPCWLDSNWLVPADKYGVPCTQMGHRWDDTLPTRMKGIVFLSSSWLEVDSRPGNALEPFSAVRPKTLLGGSAMVVYEGEFETHVLAARALEYKVWRQLKSGDRPGALESSEEAMRIASETSGAHHAYGAALVLNGFPVKGIAEHVTALRLADANPNLWKEASNIRIDLKFLAKKFDVPLPQELQ